MKTALLFLLSLVLFACGGSASSTDDGTYCKTYKDASRPTEAPVAWDIGISCDNDADVLVQADCSAPDGAQLVMSEAIGANGWACGFRTNRAEPIAVSIICKRPL